MANIEQNITNRIIDKINIIKGKENGNKKFVSDINTQVNELKNIVDELLGKLNGYILSLDEKITLFESNKEKIEELKKERNELFDLLTELGNDFDDINSKKQQDTIIHTENLTGQMNTLQKEIEKLKTENETLKQQLIKMNSDLESIEKALNYLDSTLITQDELQQVLTIIGQIKSAIAEFTKNKTYLGGGRRRRSRKFVTRKMKKRVMKGGFIADYKPKTHRRRRNNKKRYSSSSRSKKTSPSISKTTSSY